MPCRFYFFHAWLICCMCLYPACSIIFNQPKQKSSILNNRHLSNYTRFSYPAQKNQTCGVTFSNNRWSLSGEWKSYLSPYSKYTGFDCGLAFEGSKSFQIRGCCGDGVGIFSLNGCSTPSSIIPLLNTLRNQNILFVGDSLQQQTFDAFLLSLKYNGIQFRLGSKAYQNFPENMTFSEIYQCNKENKVNAAQCLATKDSIPVRECFCTKIFKAIIDDYNISITLGLAYYIMIPSQYVPLRFAIHKLNHLVMPYTLLEALFSLSDVAIVNFGVHYEDPLGALLPQSIRYITNLMSSDMKRFPWKRHFWRATYPQYYNDELHYGLFIFNDHIACQTRGTIAKRHWTDLMSSGMADEHGISIIDYYDVIKSRGDLHNKPAIGRPPNTKLDCTHWCWSEELWSGLWHLINAAVTAEYYVENR